MHSRISKRSHLFCHGLIQLLQVSPVGALQGQALPLAPQHPPAPGLVPHPQPSQVPPALHHTEGRLA